MWIYAQFNLLLAFEIHIVSSFDHITILNKEIRDPGFEASSVKVKYSESLWIPPVFFMFRMSHMMINSSDQPYLCHCPVSKKVVLPVTCQSISQDVGWASPNSSLLINGVTKCWHFVGCSGSCGNWWEELEVYLQTPRRRREPHTDLMSLPVFS